MKPDFDEDCGSLEGGDNPDQSRAIRIASAIEGVSAPGFDD
jgi:hypothetical protein